MGKETMTNIWVSREVRELLEKLKQHQRETMDEVLKRVLEEYIRLKGIKW